jgi:hypothetical protein
MTPLPAIWRFALTVRAFEFAYNRDGGTKAIHVAFRRRFAIRREQPVSARKSGIPPEKLNLYEKLLATNPGVQRKGASVPYTSLNGNMFTYLHASGAMALRLPAGEREKFLEKYKTKLFEAYGVVQKEYVTVPDALLTKTAELQQYFAMSYEYAKTLKPKPTAKKKS